MSLLATLAFAASASTASLPACSWDRPGVNPFMGDLVAAVDRYRDIPLATREKLKARMKVRAYDEIAVINRNGISGQASYAPEIREMHFGRGTVCRTVTRDKWRLEHQERGLVYCEDGQCLIVPTVCRNLSRITRLGPKPVAGAAQDDVVAVAPAAPEAPLAFEPPAAGGEAAPDSFISSLPPPPPPGPSGTPPGPFSPPGGPGPGPLPGPPTFTPPPGVPPLPPATPAVPEPGVWLMMGLGLAVLALRRRQAAR